MPISFIIFILGLVAFFTALVLCVFRRNRKQSPHYAMYWILGLVALLLCGGFAIRTAYQEMVIRMDFEVVPQNIHVTALEYNYEDFQGIGGPGDKEQVLRVFNLETEQAQRISQQGLPYLIDISNDKDWQAGPWPDSAEFYHGKVYNPQIPITSLINSLDAGIDDYRVKLDAEQAQLAERILYSPDSYYTYRHYAALLVINPKEEKLLYLVFN